MLRQQGFAFGMSFGPIIHLASVVQIVSGFLEYATNMALLVLLVQFPLGDTVMVIEVLMDDEVVVFEHVDSLVLIHGHELLDLGPILWATGVVFLKVDSVPYLLVDGGIQYQLFL